MKHRYVLMAGIVVLPVVAWMATPAAAQCTATETAKFVAGDDSAQDTFGRSVATNGQVAMVGSPGNDFRGVDAGAAYIYTPGESGWEQTRIVGSDTAAGDGFGWAVALSGPVAVVGAWKDDNSAGQDGGAAYVFRNQGGEWVEEQRLLAPDGAAQDSFGTAVAISGNVIVIGAPNDDDDGSSSGAAYVYHYNGTHWVFANKLTASDGASGDSFGRAVGVSGVHIVVGAWLAENPADSAGAAYVYRFDGADWVEEQKLSAVNPVEGDNFGLAVAVAGDQIAVGAYARDDEGTNAGAVFVYLRNGANWDFQERVHAADAAPGDGFGGAVALSEGWLVVGAGGDDDGAPNTGSAYVYSFAGSQWVQRGKLRAADATASDNFGSSVGVTGAATIVGAPDNDDGGPSSGAAYLFGGLADCNNNAVLDLCDLNNGAADCNDNGAPDDCDIASGSSADIDGNGVPDECQPDCNGNEVPDSYEIEQGQVEDCNGNGQPDTCDIQDGTSEDCDGDEEPDECEVLGPFVRTSSQMGPFGAGFPQTFTVAQPPRAGGVVAIVVYARSDLAAIAEWADVHLNGFYVGRVFMNNGHDCPTQPDTAQLTVSALDYNNMIVSGAAAVTVTASSAVDANLCGSSYVAVTIGYEAVGPDDCNANGVPDLCDVLSGVSDDDNGNLIPDECEDNVLRGDANCDGVVGFNDINPFVLLLANPAAWQSAHPGCSILVGDVNRDGEVTFRDINPFVALLSSR